MTSVCVNACIHDVKKMCDAGKENDWPVIRRILGGRRQTKDTGRTGRNVLCVLRDDDL